MGKLGGKREGAGRKPGQVSELELKRQASLQYIKDRVIAATQNILNAQIGLAVGSQYLFKLHKGDQDPKLVKDPEEMEAYLRGDYDGDKNNYYFLTAKDPDNRAIDSLMNRTHGRPTESLELSNPDGNLITVIVNKAK